MGGRAVGGALEVPTTVAEVLTRALRERGQATALVTRSRRLTYAELDAGANRAGHALLALGVRPGDRVAASLPQEAGVVLAFHGAMRIGAIWVGINRALAPPEMAYQLADSQASLHLCDATATEWEQALQAASSDPCGIAVDPDGPAGIAYTSGTTGHPKGVVHSQRNLLLPGAVTVASRGYGTDLRKGDCLPLTILNMQVLTTLLTAQAGGCCIVMDRIDALGVAEWIARERVTTFNGPPALLHDLATRPDVDPGDLASLTEVWSGGADCPEPLRRAFADRFGLPVLATYGLSEAPTLVAIDPAGRHREGASGRPLRHLRVRIATPDGADVAVRETGEVCVSAAADGPEAGRYRPMLGYWRRPEASADVLRDVAGVPELRTGDLGYVDDDGYLHIRDRTSLVILRGGANVYPAEVERVLLEHPAVAACAVVGLPDERLGQRVVAAVQLAAGLRAEAAGLDAHCRAALAKYKVPERFLVVETFERNAMGKIARPAVTALFAAADPGQAMCRA